MANNTLITSQLLAKMSLAQFVNNTPLIWTSDRMYESDFTQPEYKTGDTLRIRKRNRFITQDGQVSSPQQVLEEYEQLVINHQYNDFITFSGSELTLKVNEDQMKDRYVEPIIRSMTSKFELDAGRQAAYDLNYFIGTPGTPINSFATVKTIDGRMRELGIPMEESYLDISINDATNLQSALVNFFNPTLNENISQYAALGRLSNFDVFQSQNIYQQVAGNFGAGPITTTAIVSSGSTIPMTGLTALTTVFNKGDIFSVVGIKAINPLNYQNTSFDMQFVVTDNVISDIGGNATVPVSPAIISDANSPRRNIASAIPSGTTILPVGTHNVNVAYIKRALSVACPPLVQLRTPFSSRIKDPDLNIFLSVIETADPNAYLNLFRMDLLAGIKWHQEYAIRVIS